jgi:hypothetical protein
MEDEDHQRLVPAFQLQGQQGGLDGDRRQDQEIVAGDRGVLGPQQLGADQQGQHQRAEQAGPGLLQPEQQELIGIAVPARAPRPGPGPVVQRRDGGLDAVFRIHRVP